MKITGIGNITPFTEDKKEVVTYITSRCPELRPFSLLPEFSSVKGGQVGDIMVSDEEHRTVRRLPGISKYAIRAIEMALKDAQTGCIDSMQTALIFALTHGALNYTCKYHSSIVEPDSMDFSPLLFSESVLNAPAGNASIFFKIKGPVHTIVGENTAGLKSIRLASLLLSECNNLRVIAAATEEINHLSLFCHASFGERAISEGAVALVMEGDDTDSSAYCRIIGEASYYIPDKPEDALNRAIEIALRKARCEFSDINTIFTDSCKLSCNIPVIGFKEFFGNCFAVSPLLNIMIAAMLFKDKTLQSFFNLPSLENIMVCDVENTGEAAVVILSKVK